MTEQFTLEELQNLMCILNTRVGWDDDATWKLGKKIEKMIAEPKEQPVIEHRILGGVPVTITRTKI